MGAGFFYLLLFLVEGSKSVTSLVLFTRIEWPRRGTNTCRYIHSFQVAEIPLSTPEVRGGDGVASPDDSRGLARRVATPLTDLRVRSPSIRRPATNLPVFQSTVNVHPIRLRKDGVQQGDFFVNAYVDCSR